MKKVTTRIGSRKRDRGDRTTWSSAAISSRRATRARHPWRGGIVADTRRRKRFASSEERWAVVA